MSTVLKFALPPNNHSEEAIPMQLINRLSHITLSVNQLLFLSCAYIALVLNIPFFSKVIDAVTVNQDFNFWFLLSVPLVLLCLTVLFHSIFAFRPLLKPFLIFSVLLSSLLFYATYHYGIIFDYGMVQNTIETDTAEALSYINVYAVCTFLVLGLLPALLIYFVKIRPASLVRELSSRIQLIVVSILILSTLVGVFYVNFASVGRNNRELTSYITPFKLYEASFKYVNRSLNNAARPFHMLDAKPTLIYPVKQSNVTVLVIGETARAKNYALNGYHKPTNAHTDDIGLISFSNVSSCGTATAVSLPCMFSRLNRDEYDKHIAVSEQNAIDLIHLAGADVLWIDNNNGGCKEVCSRVESVFIDEKSPNSFCDGEYCFDEVLLEYLNDKLNNLSAKSTLIVLHVMGSHGPTYYRRYPKEHRKFTPDCPRSDIQNCTNETLMNTYDNTILYTDFILSKVVESLENLSKSKNVNASMFYISDHGESLGENGIYLHGLPYAFAPTDQTHIPMLFWQNSLTQPYDVECIKSHSKDEISHDNFFDILLGMLSVKTNVYKQQQDTFASCRN
jgi:lipid A ethanolaminephosphotransferase